MDKKKILIITHGFYPEQNPRSFRATELAKELCRQGHEVSVMAPQRPNMELLLQAFSIQFVSLGNLTWKLPKISRMGKIGALFNKAVNRLLPLLFEFPMMELFFKISRKIKEEKNTYDAVISIAVPYPVHWGVAFVWSKNTAQNIAPVWIADCGDPYILQENDTFQPPFYFRWIEIWFMRKVNYITVPTENSYRGYFPEFHSKIKIIPQGFRFEDIDQQPVVEDGIVRFGYGGGFIPGRRDPRELLEFLCSLNPSIRFEFHIFTSTSQLIAPYATKDARIKLRSPTSRVTLLKELSSFNFVVNFANVGTAQTPSKLIDYVIIDKPVLHIETGNLNSQIVVDFLEGNYEKGFVIANPDRYRIETVAKQFIKLIECGKSQ